MKNPSIDNLSEIIFEIMGTPQEHKPVDGGPSDFLPFYHRPLSTDPLIPFEVFRLPLRTEFGHLPSLIVCQILEVLMNNCQSMLRFCQSLGPSNE
jgi:hypothetical protein